MKNEIVIFLKVLVTFNEINDVFNSLYPPVPTPPSPPYNAQEPNRNYNNHNLTSNFEILNPCATQDP